MNKHDLTQGVSMLKYFSNILLQGPELNGEDYETIRCSLPAEFQRRLIGWQRIGKTRAEQQNVCLSVQEPRQQINTSEAKENH